jgi:transcriptional regulator with XRE-family HTH domain
MPNNSGNIYKICRETAGITQERAAEYLDVSVRCLSAYENGERMPSGATVIRMVDVYGTPHLALQHMRLSSEVGEKYLSEIEIRDLPSAIMRLQKELDELLDCRKEIIAITWDGVITSDERPRWNAILKEFDDVSSAIMSVKFAITKGGDGENDGS